MDILFLLYICADVTHGLVICLYYDLLFGEKVVNHYNSELSVNATLLQYAFQNNPNVTRPQKILFKNAREKYMSQFGNGHSHSLCGIYANLVII